MIIFPSQLSNNADAGISNHVILKALLLLSVSTRRTEEKSNGELCEID